MKLQPDRFDTLALTGHGPGWVAVNGERVTRSLVVSSQGQRLDWACDTFEALTPDHFSRLLEWRPEIILFGSGDRLRFPAPALVRHLVANHMSVETMDTRAACRTYNILAGEGRRVVAALLIEAETSGQTG